MKKQLTELKDAEAYLAKMDKDADNYDEVKAFVGKLKKVSKEERKTFNNNLSEMVNKAAAFAKASNTLDNEVRALSKVVDAEDDHEDLKATAKLAMAPIEHRDTIRKVSDALGNLSKESGKVDAKAAKLN